MTLVLHSVTQCYSRTVIAYLYNMAMAFFLGESNKATFILVDALLLGHASSLLLAFALERVLTSERTGGAGEDRGEEGLESGTNSGGLTTLSLPSSLLTFFCLKCLSQWFTKVSILTKVLLHTLQ